MRLHSWLAGGAAGLLLSLVLTPTAQADGLEIEHVDSAADGATTVLVSLPSSVELTTESVTLSVDDSVLPVRSVAAGDSVERITMLVLDTSRSMIGAPIEAAKQAASDFLSQAPAEVKIGLTTFDGTVRDMVDPTTDRSALQDALGTLTLGLGTKLYDGVNAAIGSAGDRGARSLLVLSDGRDVGSSASLSSTVQAVRKSGVVVDVVSLDQHQAGRQPMQRLVEASGGEVLLTDPTSLNRIFTDRADQLAHQMVLRFTAPVDVQGSATVEVVLSTDSGVLRDAAYVPLQASKQPMQVVATQGAVGTPVLMLGGAVLAFGLASVLWLLLGKRRTPSLASRIEHFAGNPQRTHSDVGNGEDQVSLKESAVGAAGLVLRGDFESRVSDRLAGAGSRLTAAEWLLVHAGVAVGALGLGTMLGGGGLRLLMLGAGLIGPWIYLRVRHGRRKKAYSGQLAETLQLIAGGMSAGLSMPQAIDTVVREAAAPMADELRKAMIEQRLGVDVTDALESMARRMDSDDTSWVVMAMRIQREVGGNLSELLNTVADTLRERDDIRRQVAVLSAEGRLSAWVLSMLPVAMFAYMMVVRRELIRPMYTEPLGIVMLSAGAFWLAIGMFWMSRMTKIEV